jgi:putative heme-binding domain-containing protein
MWANPAARKNNLRFIRRFAAEGTRSGYDACFQMIASAPKNNFAAAQPSLRLGLAERAVGLESVGQGELFANQAANVNGGLSAKTRKYEPVTGPLLEHIESLWLEYPGQELSLELALRAGVEAARDTISSSPFETGLTPDQRVRRLKLLREFGDPSATPKLFQLVLSGEPEPVLLAALEVLATFSDAEMNHTLLSAYAKLPTTLQGKVRDTLASRPMSAMALLQKVDSGVIPASDLAIDQLRRMALHGDQEIDALVRKHWGNIGPGTPEEKLATMRRYNNDLRAGTGDPVGGKQVYAKSCGICHQLVGEGNKIGPDLTTANRQDLAALLGNIVDPSAVVRREYVSYVAITTSGRVHSGLIAEQDGASITILDAKNERIRIPREEIDTLEEAETSLMPERILDELTPQQIRDLFAYIQSAPSK